MSGAARTGALGVGLAKGELYTLDASGNLVRVAAGTTGQVLGADTGLANGMGWVYPQTSAFYPPQYANAFGARRVANVANAGLTQITVHVPVDFQSLTGLFIRFLPNANIVAKTVTITVNGSGPGVINTANPAGPTGFVYTANGGIDTEIDISSMVSGFIAAEQIIGLGITNTDGGTTMSFEGAILKYRRKIVF